MPRTRRSIPPSTTCVGRVDAFLTRAIFKHMLRRQAYSRDDFARMAAVLAVRPRRHRGGGDGVRRLAAQIVRDDLRRSGRAPDRNMTGFTIFPATITGKYLSMLKEMTPQLARVAILYS